VTTHEGRFQTETDVRYLADEPREVRVRLPEEKGSDVNLATYLLLDAWDGEIAAAVVISDDFDLEEPLRVVRQFDIHLTVVSPRHRRQLANAVKADAFKKVHETLLQECQMPDEVLDREFRHVHRPPTWA
jgi:hypothetical protein